MRRSAAMISLDLVALDHLVAKQALGDLVEQVAVVGEQLLGAAVGLLGDRLDLLVARLAQRLGDREVVARDLVGADRRPHPVLVDHRARDRGHPAEVVGGAGGHPAEGDLLGDAAGEQHLHVVDQLLARLQVAVLLRQVERVAERLAAGDDRDLLHLVDASAAARRRARARPRARRRRASRASVITLRDCSPATTRSNAFSKSAWAMKSRLLRPARIAASLARLARSAPVRPAAWRATRSRSTSWPSGLPRGMDLEDLPAAAHVRAAARTPGGRSARAQQRLVELLEHVRGGHHDDVVARRRSRPSRPAAGSGSGRARPRCRSRGGRRPRRARR